MSEMLEMVVRSANCMDVSTGQRNATRIAKRAMVTEGEFGMPDIVGFSEVATVNVEFIAGLYGFTGLQFGRVPTSTHGNGDPKSGTALAANSNRFRMMGFEQLKTMSDAQEGIRERYAVGDKIKPRGPYKPIPFWATHAPPDRAPKATKQFYEQVPKLRGIVIADYNETRSQMRERVSRQYKGIEVLGIIIPNWMVVSSAWPVDIGSDHQAVDVCIHIPKRVLR